MSYLNTINYKKIGKILIEGMRFSLICSGSTSFIITVRQSYLKLHCSTISFLKVEWWSVISCWPSLYWPYQSFYLCSDMFIPSLWVRDSTLQHIWCFCTHLLKLFHFHALSLSKTLSLSSLSCSTLVILFLPRCGTTHFLWYLVYDPSV